MVTMKVFLLLITIASLNEAAKILVLFPMCARSHDILGKGVSRNLLAAGHEVTQVTCFPYTKAVPNLKEIDFSHYEKKFRDDKEHAELFKLKNLVGKKNFADSLMFFYMTYKINVDIISDEVFTNLLSDPNSQFDAVITEWFFSDIFAGIPPLFKCPFILFGTTEVHWQILRVVDEIPNPAYSTDIYATYRPPLSFWERTQELWKLSSKYLVTNFVVVPLEKYFYNSYFAPIASKRGVTMPSYDEAVYNISLLLVNSHPSLGTPFRLPQNAKYIGGYHINPKVDSLPQDLQKLMDNAAHGVIYFSMGSNLKSMDMSDKMKTSLLDMFSKFKQTVIWKFESDLSNVPSNVHLLKWAPQQGILAHPNLKTFITHGGQLSTTEAVHYGVPVVGIPVFGDQYVNMKSSVAKGFGIEVKLSEDMYEELSYAIEEILRNPKYGKKAKELSFIYHHRPVPPGKELVHWVEHVIQTKGARHLRSPAIDVPLYQRAYLDLIGVIAAIGYVLYSIIRRLFRKKDASKISKTKAKRN